MDNSILSDSTGLFSRALRNPALNFSSSKGSLIPFDLIILGITRSASSYVENLSPQCVHSLLLLICDPSATSLESITFVSSLPQKGQNIIYKPEILNKVLQLSFSLLEEFQVCFYFL